MKLILRSFRSPLRLTVSQQYIPSQTIHFSRQFIPKHSLWQSNHRLLLMNTSYAFSTSKQEQNPNSQSSSSPNNNTKDFKLAQLKQIFETKMNKYNLKALIKIYRTLKLNNVALSPTSIKQFDYRVILEVNSIDHPSANLILQMCYQNGQNYQPKSSNKLLRAINLKFQKHKFTLIPQHVYKTLKILTQMKFPKLTICRVIFSLVKQTDTNKRVIKFMDNLNVLRISLMAVEMVELDLQVKKRVLQNLLQLKAKGVVQLGYFYSIIRTTVSRLDEAVAYEARKKTVYDLAFNPYSMHQQQTESPGQASPVTQNSPVNTSGPQNLSQVNPAIISRLIKQKQHILQQTLNKLDVKQLSQQLYNQLTVAMKEDSQVEWKEVKRLCLLLIDCGFGAEGKDKKGLVEQMVGRVLAEGLKVDDNTSNSSQPTFYSSKFIRLPQFIILAQYLFQSSPQPTKTLAPYFSAYHTSYQHFMNLQQKLMFTYHESKLLCRPINLHQVKQIVTQISYGLDPQQFGWLNKVLSLNQSSHIQKDRHLIKEIWAIVERCLDQELEILHKEKVQQQMRQAQQIKDKEERQKNMKQNQYQNNNHDKKPKNTSRQNQGQSQ